MPGITLPERFQPRGFKPPPGEPDTASAHILGSWLVRGSDPREPETFLGIWVDLKPGYPTAGLPLGYEQTEFEECGLGSTALPGRLAAFSLRDSLGEPTQYIAAFWRLADDAWLRALAFTHHSTDSVVLRHVMGTFKPGPP